MKLYHLNQTQEVQAPLSSVFEFFCDPRNLEKLTPPSMKMRILTPGDRLMRAGSVIDYVVSVGGVPVRWTAYIAQFEPPARFVDIQLRGPFAFWHHTHSFLAQGASTTIEDDIIYALPGGPLGRLAHGLFVNRGLKTMFAFRRQRLEQECSRAGA